MAFSVEHHTKSVLVEGDRAWSCAFDLCDASVDAAAAVRRLLDDSGGRADVMQCARALGEQRLANHPADTRRVLQALDLLDDALDHIEPR